jgi:hypothetical protein
MSKRSIANFAERLAFRFYEARHSLDKTRKRGEYPPNSVSKYIQRWLNWISKTYEKISNDRVSRISMRV